MATTWVIVADSARARVLEAESANGPLTEVDALVHPASRLHPQKITSDLPGRSFDRGGQGRHAMESQVDPRRHEQVRFATEIADYLGAARTEGRFERLVIIAGPAFLGHLREKLDAPTAHRVTTYLNKDYSRLSPEEIGERLHEALSKG